MFNTTVLLLPKACYDYGSRPSKKLNLWDYIISQTKIEDTQLGIIKPRNYELLLCLRHESWVDDFGPIIL